MCGRGILYNIDNKIQSFINTNKILSELFLVKVKITHPPVHVQ